MDGVWGKMPDDWGRVRKDKWRRATTFECDMQSTEKLQVMLSNEKKTESELETCMD